MDGAMDVGAAAAARMCSRDVTTKRETSRRAVNDDMFVMYAAMLVSAPKHAAWMNAAWIR